jgi:predicted metal-binding protein
MTKATLFVCSLCRFSATEKNHDGVSGGEFLINSLQTAITENDLETEVQIHPVRCMAQCGQPCNVTLAAPGKLTFILSGLSPTESTQALTEFCKQYAHFPDGKVPYRQRSATIQQATAFVLPPLPANSST